MAEKTTKQKPQSALTNHQKKEWAKTLFIKDNLTQKEIAERVGSSQQTICKWVNEGKWEDLKTSVSLTRQEQLSNLYRMVAEVNKGIMSRKEGERIPSAKEADILIKLGAAIEKMEKETSISDVISVSIKVLEWLRPVDPAKAKELSGIFDAFIKDQLK